jgi:hypothetical protein
MVPMLRCVDCDEEVRPGAFYREVIGWEKPRADGGANQITLRTETGRVRCSGCVESAKLGGQRPML